MLKERVLEVGEEGDVLSAHPHVLIWREVGLESPEKEYAAEDPDKLLVPNALQQQRRMRVGDGLQRGALSSGCVLPNLKTNEDKRADYTKGRDCIASPEPASGSGHVVGHLGTPIPLWGG